MRTNMRIDGVHAVATAQTVAMLGIALFNVTRFSLLPGVIVAAVVVGVTAVALFGLARRRAGLAAIGMVLLLVCAVLSSLEAPM